MEREVVKLEQRFELALKQLEKEEEDEEGYPIAQWWEVESDYQPTECGNDGSGYLPPVRELEQQGQPLL